MFKKGDRVRWNSIGKEHVPDRNKERVGTYVSSGRDLASDRVLWDGATKPCTYNQGFLELAPDGADDDEEVKFRTAVRTILRGFEEGVFVRSTANDHDPRWAIRLFPFLRALAVAQETFGLPQSADAVDPSASDPGTPTPRE